MKDQLGQGYVISAVPSLVGARVDRIIPERSNGSTGSVLWLIGGAYNSRPSSIAANWYRATSGKDSDQSWRSSQIWELTRERKTPKLLAARPQAIVVEVGLRRPWNAMKDYLMKEDDARRLLDRVAILRHACDLDLTLFFARHPRALLASESLASFLGYELKQIADSLEVLLAAGLIKRTQTPAHAARLYLLVPDSVERQWLQPLVEMGSTRQGLAALRRALRGEGTEAPESVKMKGNTASRSNSFRREQRSHRTYRRGGR